jgi:anti-sigma factor RsiW
MTPASQNHLSDEALDDLLIGLGSPESDAHLARCPECRAQVETFRGDLQLFNAASMAWSRSRLPGLRQVHHAAVRTRVAFASWAAVSAALAILAFAIWHHRVVPTPTQAHTVQSQPVDSEAQIAQDNQLLQAVNAAISPNDVSPVDEYKILESPHRHTKPGSHTRKK